MIFLVGVFELWSPRNGAPVNNVGRPGFGAAPTEADRCCADGHESPDSSGQQSIGLAYKGIAQRDGRDGRHLCAVEGVALLLSGLYNGNLVFIRPSIHRA